MAYLRGDYYIWSDSDDRIHIWVKDGFDGWDDTGWCCDEDSNRSVGYENASGVCLPEEVMDEFVLMRVAELIIDGKINETIDRLMAPEGRKGNFGSMALMKNAQKLKQTLSQLSLEEPDYP